MSKQEAFRQLCEQYKEHWNIQKGSKLRVFRRADDYEMGWGTVWANSMDARIGQEITVDRWLFDVGFLAKEDGKWYPFFVLEHVSDPQKTILPCSEDYKAEILSNGNVVVGCQTISFENLENIYNAAKSKLD